VLQYQFVNRLAGRCKPIIFNSSPGAIECGADR
jgi:hypothetical protein